MKNKLMTYAIIVILIIAAGFIIVSMKNNTKKTANSSNFNTIHEVRGVAFGVNSSIINKATAVSEISEKIDIDPSLIYIYKDGKNRYLLFGLNSIVIAVEKGTKFPLHENMTDLDLESASVCGIWFEQSGLKLQSEYDSNSVTFQAIGGLNISNNTYSDYAGKLRIISDGTDQWAIFCGIPGADRYKDLSDNAKNGIDAIVASLQFSDYVEPSKEEVYAVKIDNSDMADVASADINTTDDEIAPKENVTVPIQETEDASETETKASEVEVTEETETETEVVAESETGETSEESSEEDTEGMTEESAEKVTTEEKESSIEGNEPNAPAFILEEEEEHKSRGSSVQLENQKKVANKKSNEAYTSTIYSMLSLKDNGIICEMDRHTKQINTPIINVSRVYKGKTAVNMIKDYCSTTGNYEYFDAPVGCEWHVAEYSLLYKDCTTKPYIDIKLRGIDGNNIVYKGISYTKHTYDMLYKAEWNGDFYGTCYCFYAVPIGVREYALECGLGTVKEDTGSQAAYYHIKY